jgi:hypothetical protein
MAARSNVENHGIGDWKETSHSQRLGQFPISAELARATGRSARQEASLGASDGAKVQILKTWIGDEVSKVVEQVVGVETW